MQTNKIKKLKNKLYLNKNKHPSQNWESNVSELCNGSATSGLPIGTKNATNCIFDNHHLVLRNVGRFSTWNIGLFVLAISDFNDLALIVHHFLIISILSSRNLSGSGMISQAHHGPKHPQVSKYPHGSKHHYGYLKTRKQKFSQINTSTHRNQVQFFKGSGKQIVNESKARQLIYRSQIALESNLRESKALGISKTGCCVVCMDLECIVCQNGFTLWRRFQIILWSELWWFFSEADVIRWCSTDKVKKYLETLKGFLVVLTKTKQEIGDLPGKEITSLKTYWASWFIRMQFFDLFVLRKEFSWCLFPSSYKIFRISFALGKLTWWLQSEFRKLTSSVELPES